MTAAKAVARSSGAVLLVSKPKIAEPAPVPIPEENSSVTGDFQEIEVKPGALDILLHHVLLSSKNYNNISIIYIYHPLNPI